ncbi:MAG: tetratricopeptide repeat protein [Candidatus Sedimenticola sp. (ex Thyasira tokunagai)]
MPAVITVIVELSGKDKIGKLINMSFHNIKILLITVSLLLLVSGCSSPDEKAAEYLKSGQALLDKGEYKSAILEFRNALQIKKDLVPAWYGWSKAAEKQGRWKQSYKLLNNVVSLDPNHIDARIKRGKIRLAAKLLDKALEESDETLKLAPGNPDVRAFRAAVLFKLGDTDGAIREADRALSLEPGHVDALIVRATERLLAGNAEAAITYLDKGIASHERNVALQLIKIKALSSLDAGDKAADVFERLIELYPENIAFRRAFAQFYVSNKQIDKAEAVLRQIVVDFPADLDKKLSLVKFLLANYGLDKAVTELDKYISENPDEYKYQFALAEIYISQKQQERAKEVLNKVVAKDAEGANGIAAKSRLAALALSAGEKNEALLLIEDVLALEPKNSSALLIKATMQLTDRKIEDAIATLRTVLKNDSGSVNALALLAKAHLSNKSPQLAKENYQRAIKIDPVNQKIVLEYARLLIKGREADQAGELLQKFIDRVPNSVAALQMMAQVKLSQRDWATAQQIAERLRDLDSKALSDQILGVVYQGRQQYDQSIEAFKRAHDASPLAVQPIVSLVRTYVRAGKQDDAERFLQSVLNIHPENLFAHILMGQLHLLAKDTESAEGSFAQAISLNPNNDIGYRAMANVLLTQKKPVKALEVINEGLGVIPDNLSLSLAKAGILEQEGEYDQAIEVYEKILKKNPNIDLAANNLASLLTDHRKDKRSLETALKYAKRFEKSKMPYFKDTLGWVHYQLGNAKDATPLLKSAADALPTLSIFHYHVGKSLLAEGDKAGAKEALTRAISLSDQSFIELDDAKQALDGL